MSWLRFRRPSFLYPGEEMRSSLSMGRSRRHLVLEGKEKHALEVGRVRLLFAASVFTLAFCAIAVRLFDVMVLGAMDRRARPVLTAEVDIVPYSRADIVDRDGLLLATNLPTVNLYADTQKIIDPQNAAAQLVQALPHLNYQTTLGRLASGRRFIYLERNLTPIQQQGVNAQGIPGAFFENAERRVYLQGPLFSHVLGATDPDNKGIAGLELAFNDALSKDPVAPLRLTVDAKVQHTVRAILQKNMRRFKAVAASAVVMDVRTGEIMSLVSLPDYQPESFGNASAAARFNRVTLGVYEMGSIFKLFNTAMALESGKIRVEDVYDTVKPLKVARFTIRDIHRQKKWLSVEEILTKSSNIGSARIASQLGTSAQQEFLGRLGLLETTRVELPEIGHPLYPRVWRDINTMTISFGHGIAVAPISMVRGLAAIVNGGFLVQPTLVANASKDPVPQRVLREETSLIMRRLMRRVVTDGTGRRADAPGYLVGGKTGTAEKVSAQGGYSAKKNLNSFAGAFPMHDPQYAVVVTLDEPKGLQSTWGLVTSGWNVAPAAGEIIAAIGPMLGIHPVKQDRLYSPRDMQRVQADGEDFIPGQGEAVNVAW